MAQVGVFSTYVEVFLQPGRLRATGKSFLHVCGGVSGKSTFIDMIGWFSPRMWRCF